MFYRAVPPPSLMVFLKKESGPIVYSGRARSHHAHRDHNHHQYYHRNLLDRSPADIPELIAEVLVASDKGEIFTVDHSLQVERATIDK